MKFPENIEDIEGFYRQNLSGKEVVPADAMWEAIQDKVGASNMGANANPASVVQTTAKVISIKGVLGIVSVVGVVGLSTFGYVYFDGKNTNTDVPHKQESNQLPLASDTLAMYVPEKEEKTEINSYVPEGQAAKKVVTTDHKSIETSSKGGSQTLTNDEKVVETLGKKEPKHDSISVSNMHEPIKEEPSLNFFQRKAREQKDSSNSLFKKKEK